MDLLYQLDNQVNLGDVEEIQQAKDAMLLCNQSEIK
jgi:hypothetical protein